MPHSCLRVAHQIMTAIYLLPHSLSLTLLLDAQPALSIEMWYPAHCCCSCDPEARRAAIFPSSALERSSSALHRCKKDSACPPQPLDLYMHANSFSRPKTFRSGGQVGLRHVAYVTQATLRVHGVSFAEKQFSTFKKPRDRGFESHPEQVFCANLLRSQNENLDHRTPTDGGLPSHQNIKIKKRPRPPSFSFQKKGGEHHC